MRDDLGSCATEHGCPEVMVRMMMSEDHPFNRPPGYRSDRPQELLSLAWTGQGVHHYDAGVRNHEPGVGTSFRASTSVTNSSVDTRRQLPQRWHLRSPS